MGKFLILRKSPRKYKLSILIQFIKVNVVEQSEYFKINV